MPESNTLWSFSPSHRRHITQQCAPFSQPPLWGANLSVLTVAIVSDLPPARATHCLCRRVLPDSWPILSQGACAARGSIREPYGMPTGENCFLLVIGENTLNNQVKVIRRRKKSYRSISYNDLSKLALNKSWWGRNGWKYSTRVFPFIYHIYPSYI